MSAAPWWKRGRKRPHRRVARKIRRRYLPDWLYEAKRARWHRRALALRDRLLAHRPRTGVRYVIKREGEYLAFSWARSMGNPTGRRATGKAAQRHGWNHFPPRRAWGHHWMHNRGFFQTPHLDRATRFRSGRSALAALRYTQWAFVMYEGVELVAVPSSPPAVTHGHLLREDACARCGAVPRACSWCPAGARHFNEAHHACDHHKPFLLNLPLHAPDEAVEQAERERELGAYTPNTECNACDPWA